MQILSASKEIIDQLIGLCSKLTPEQYSRPMDLLANNSVGKHIRHIIEFYDILKNSKENNGILSYDLREHCTKTETEVKTALQRLNGIKKWFEEVNLETSLNLVISYDKNARNNFQVKTNMKRELVYNIEHAIHHMAIIRIAVEKEFGSIILDKQFGVAFSTIRYRDDSCAR